MTKSQLRKEVLEAREAMSAADAARKSAIIINKLLVLEEYRAASTILAYLDFRNEVQTSQLVKEAMAAGKRLAVPFTGSGDSMLTPSLLSEYPGDLERCNRGILEPKPGCLRPLEPAELDMVIVPGVVFDQRGYRLGYGAGFYDRFLPRTRPDTVFAALAYELQIRPDVYPGPHDIPVHLLITEKRLIFPANHSY